MSAIARWMWLWLAVGCASAIDVVGSESGAASAGPIVPGATTPSAAPDRVPGPVLRRLTVPQYQNSLVELFGDTIERPTELEVDTVLHGFASIGAAQVALSPRATELLEGAALKVAQQALTDPARRMGLVGCAPAGGPGDTCVRAFLRRFGRKAWRRPLADGELERYAGVADLGARELSDPWAGLSYAIAGMLQSPNFVYRVELGTPAPGDPSQRVFDGYELATRLSFLLWNSTPDDALLDAAAAGQLATPEGLRAQAERLLATPRARTALESFWRELLRLSELDALPHSVTAYPQATPTLGAAMRAETLAVLDGLVFDGDGDYRRLFTADRTVVNGELASLYGIAGVTGSGMQAVAMPVGSPRRGLLGQASFLALNAHATSTSPTRRGKFVREALLCQAIPAPPPNVSTELPPDGAQGPRTMRQKLETHRSQAQCAGCHALMDPIGLAFEQFDGIGAYRATDRGLAIDASGELDGRAFRDAAELGQVLSEHPLLGPCLTRSLLRYSTGRLESAVEQPLIERLSGSFAAQHFQVRALLSELVQSEAFRRAGALE